MKAHFIRLFSFNAWANKAVADFILAEGMRDEAVLLLASHIAHAQRNWYLRVTGQQNDVPVWTPLEPASVLLQLAQNDELWLEYLNGLQDHDLYAKLAYKNMAGEPYLDNLADILTHLVNHSTYHRGQIVYLSRGLGFTPPGTDFIRFARQFPG